MLTLLYVCVFQQHDLRLVALAAGVCLFACFTASNLYARAADPRQSRRELWSAGAAVVFGCGVWATHFVAELAYQPGVPVGYDLTLTALSALIAVAISGLGLAVALHFGRPAIGGGIVGAAVGAMHYTGVAAMRFPGTIVWSWGWVGASVAIGVAVAAAAFAVQARAPSALRNRAAAAGLLVLAICGLHFTAMTALTLAFDPSVTVAGNVMAPQLLAVAVAGVTAGIITLGLTGSIADDQLAQRAIGEAARLQQKVAERTEELHHAQAELLHSARLSTIGQLTASIAHELRNPLSAVRNSLFALRELTGGTNPAIKRALDRSERSVARCARIISDLLDYTHARELQCRPTQLDSWLGEAVESYAAPGVAVALEPGAPGTRLPMDGERMRRALVNLLDNAMHAVSDIAGERRIAVSSRRAGNAVELTVADTGCGIAPEHLGQIFEPLFTTKSFGTGLGLPTVKRIVEQHGGTVAIASELGRGTRVTLRLPLAGGTVALAA